MVYSFREYQRTEGEVISRPNRFVVNLKTEAGERTCHLHDPGRLKELIYKGNRVLIRDIAGMKTDCSILAAKSEKIWIPLDSRIHNRIASRFISGPVKPEVQVGRKRLDFLSGNEYIEVKGCTLKTGEAAMFPDAPTKRGTEHLKTLVSLLKEGYNASVIILVLRNDVECFYPNYSTDRDFSEAFFEADKWGVSIRIFTFSFDGTEIRYEKEIGICDHHN
ncbi:MAG: DNA/RNA nuclease SfsA [Thermoplasmata archaeon]